MYISLAAEPLFYLGSFPVTNSFLAASLVIVFLSAFSYFSTRDIKQIPRTKLQVIAFFIVSTIYNLTKSVAGLKAKEFAPLIGSFFLFILIGNWSGLMPGVGSLGFYDKHHNFVPFLRGATADLNMTLALALVSVFVTQYYGLKYLHLSYLKKFINFESPIKFFVGILEIVSEIAKIISFSFRLFGNIFAGEVLLVVISFLAPILAPTPFFVLEIFVGFVQALVFAMLTLVFLNMATVSHE